MSLQHGEKQEPAGSSRIVKCALCIDLFRILAVTLCVQFQGIVLAAEQQAGVGLLVLQLYENVLSFVFFISLLYPDTVSYPIGIQIIQGHGSVIRLN